jgi:hypothetical protein
MDARAIIVLVPLLAAGSPGARADETVIRTSPPPVPKPPAPAGQVRFRAYDGFGVFGPVPDVGAVPIGIDVSVDLVRCADGNTEVGAMTIGGWDAALTGTCSRAERPGTVEVTGAATAAPAQPTLSTRPADEPGGPIHCDPSTWHCAPATTP